MSILSKREKKGETVRAVVVGIEQMTINGVTRRQRQFQFIF